MCRRKKWWEYNHLSCRFKSGIEAVGEKETILYYYYYVCCCAPLVAAPHPIRSPFYLLLANWSFDFLFSVTFDQVPLPRYLLT